MPRIATLKKKLDHILEKFKKGERRGLVLAMLAAIRLSDKGKAISVDNIVEEAKMIIDEFPNIDWGVSKEEFTPGLASSLLKELVEMGVLEPTDTSRFIFKTYESGSPRDEILARFGYLIFYGGLAR